MEKERRGAPKKGSRRALAATLCLSTARLSVTLFVLRVTGKTTERVPRIPLYPVSPLHVDLQ